MSTGFFAGFIEPLYTTPQAINFLTGDLAAVLYPSANAPSDTNLQDETINTLGGLNTATSGSVEDNSHDALLASKTIGSLAPYVFDAADTTIGSAATGASETKDILLLLRAGAEPATGDLLIAYFDLTTPVTPNGQDITVQWSAQGVCRLGGHSSL